MTPLRQRMLDALVLRGMALRTQESYIDAVSVYEIDRVQTPGSDETP